VVWWLPTIFWSRERGFECSFCTIFYVVWWLLTGPGAEQAQQNTLVSPQGAHEDRRGQRSKPNRATMKGIRRKRKKYKYRPTPILVDIAGGQEEGVVPKGSGGCVCSSKEETQEIDQVRPFFESISCA
jgi:hypothetical protein